MGDIRKAMHADIDYYEALCKKYGEKIEAQKTAEGVLVPDCYGAHALSLRQRETEIEADRQKRLRAYNLSLLNPEHSCPQCDSARYTQTAHIELCDRCGYSQDYRRPV